MNFRKDILRQPLSAQIVQLPRNVTNSQLAQKFGEWMAVQGYLPNVQAEYARTVEQFCKFLGRKPIRAVSLQDLGQFFEELDTAHRRSESYLRNSLCKLRCFFDFLCLNGLVPMASPHLFKFRTPPAKLPRVLSRSEVRRILTRTRDLRARAVLELIYATGCRAVEVARMQIRDVDFQRREIRVCGKRAERIVYFGKPAKRALLRYLKHRREGPLFVDRHPPQRGHLAHVAMRWYACWDQYSNHGVPTTQRLFLGESRGQLALTRSEAERRFYKFVKTVRLGRVRHQLNSETIIRITRRAGERAGVQAVTPKVLRSSFATHMLEKGADVHCVQRLLGHRRLSTTQVYLNVSNAHVANAYRRYHPRAM